MNCSEVREQGIRLEGGAQASTVHAALSKHVASCAECRQFFSELDASWEALEQYPQIEPSAGFKSEVMRSVRLSLEHRKRWKLCPETGWQWMAAAAGLLLIISLLTFQFPERRQTAQAESAEQSERWEEEFMRDLDRMLQTSATDELSDYDSWPGAELEILLQEPNNPPPAEKTKKKGVGSHEGA